jgi:hypothetical protein
VAGALPLSATSKRALAKAASGYHQNVPIFTTSNPLIIRWRSSLIMDNLAAVDRVCDTAVGFARLFKNNFADGRTEGRLREISGWVVTAVGVRAASGIPVAEVRFNSF